VIKIFRDQFPPPEIKAGIAVGVGYDAGISIQYNFVIHFRSGGVKNGGAVKKGMVQDKPNKPNKQTNIIS